MKSILDIFHKWCNWNHKQVGGGEYTYTQEDQYLMVEKNYECTGSVLYHWGTGGFEGTFNLIEGSYIQTQADITVGSETTVRWDNNVQYLIVNGNVIVGQRPERTYNILVKNGAVEVEKGNNGTLHIELTNQYGEHSSQTIPDGFGTTLTFAAQVGSIMKFNWDSGLAYLKIDGNVIVG